MKLILIAIHGILTAQTNPSWPDQFDAWMFRRDPRVKVLKKEYAAGPFPRWNCFVKDRRLAESLANEVELLIGQESLSPSTWFLAHSNGAVIALETTKRLIERGHRVGGLILTGAASEADLERNRVLEWVRSGALGAAAAYCAADDRLLPEQPLSLEEGAGGRKRLRHKLANWFWSRLVWPYGGLGRTGWTLQGRSVLSGYFPGITARWFSGGHSTYFKPANIQQMFGHIYADIAEGLAKQPLHAQTSHTDK